MTEIERLSKHILELQKDKGELTDKVAELEAQLAISEHDREHNDYELTEVYKKIEVLEKENAELKELLKKWVLTPKASGCDNINIVTDTEQFLSEVEK